MIRDVKIGCISWIAAKKNPITLAASATALEPAWIPKTYVGLAATSNPDPADSISDFKAFQAAKNFRAMQFCSISIDVDDATGKVNSFKVKDAFHDPGWTPPFNHLRISGACYPTAIIDSSTWGSTYHQGEASSVSLVNTQSRHKNSTLTIPADETVLVNGIIKFRAGKHTDDIGVKTVGAKFHVPWVWSEMALTFKKGGQLKFYGRGSIFPTHAWYMDGVRVMKIDEAGDSSFPAAAICIPTPQFGAAAMSGRPGTACLPSPTPLMSGINVSALNLYKVLSKGVSSASPQSDLSSEAGCTGILTTHANTVEGGAAVTK